MMMNGLVIGARSVREMEVNANMMWTSREHGNLAPIVGFHFLATDVSSSVVKGKNDYEEVRTYQEFNLAEFLSDEGDKVNGNRNNPRQTKTYSGYQQQRIR